MHKIFALALGVTMLVASGSALANGEKDFKKRCGSCHTVDAGKHKTGPSLAGMVGKKAGTTDFKRYKGLKGADFTWDEAKLDAWMTDSRKFAQENFPSKKTTMSVKIKKAEERKEIIEYMKKH